MSPRPGMGPREKMKISSKDGTKTLSKLMQSTKKYWIAFIFAAIFILTNVVIAVIAPNYVDSLTNEIAYNAFTASIDLDVVFKYVTLLGIMYVASEICSYVSSFIIATVTQIYANSLRKSIVSKINVLPLSYFDSKQIGDTLSRVTNDVDSLSQSIDTAISSFLSAIFMLVGSLIGMFVKCWQLALISLIAIPLMLFFVAGIMKLAMPQFVNRQNQIGVVQGNVEEKFSGQLVIKLFNAEDKQDAIFEEKNQKLKEYMFKAQFFGGLMMPMTTFISYLCYGAVIVGGGLLMINKVPGVNMGTISAFMIYIRLFQQPFTQISQALIRCKPP